MTGYQNGPVRLNNPGRRVPLADVEGLAWMGEQPSAGRKRRFQKALAAGMEECLTQRQRQIVEMYYFAGLSMEQVAQTLGIGRPAVCRSLKASREKLRLVGRIAAALLET